MPVKHHLHLRTRRGSNGFISSRAFMKGKMNKTVKTLTCDVPLPGVFAIFFADPFASFSGIVVALLFEARECGPP